MGNRILADNLHYFSCYIVLSLIFGRNADLLLTLIKKLWSLRVDPGGHSFLEYKCLLNTAINKKPYFVLEVVIYKNKTKHGIAPDSGYIESRFVGVSFQYRY